MATFVWSCAANERFQNSDAYWITDERRIFFTWRDHAVWRGIELINTTRKDVNESQDNGERHCRDELSNILVIFVTRS